MTDSLDPWIIHVIYLVISDHFSTYWRLEKDLGFSNRSVSKWNESEPGIRKVQKVADYLGVTIEELLK